MKSVAGIALVGLVLLGWALITRQPPGIEVSNRSGLEITELRLSVGEVEVARTGMRPGDLDRHSVPLRREGPVRVSVRFGDADARQLSAGWFNPGQSGLTRIEIVAPDSVRIGI